MLRTGNKGFTFIEAMAATLVLALGSVLIYRAFFITLDSYNYCNDRLAVSPWMSGKLWEVENYLSRSPETLSMENRGMLLVGRKSFDWEMAYGVVDEIKDVSKLYDISLTVSWEEGRRKVGISRNAYALYKK